MGGDRVPFLKGKTGAQPRLEKKKDNENNIEPDKTREKMEKFDILPVSEWGLGNNDLPIGIAGPCSAETEEQVMETARGLVHKNIHVFRAGIWKPRTRPGCFEGVGEVGLGWLQRVRRETGLKIGTEVANAEHVRLALKYDVDVLWIGARTTASPFAMQELAEMLRDTDKVVLVKNPMNPDLDLWLGALERLNVCGVRKLGAIHRGFSSYAKTKYRNVPQWAIPIELRRRHPELPIVCDPSHISGCRELVMPVSQMALNLHFDGLMIETHCRPDEAWSDASQQLVPQRTTAMTEELYLRSGSPTGEDATRLAALRQQIDEIDNQLVSILSARMKVAREIGAVKRDSNMPILQSTRWVDVLGKNVADGSAQGLSEDFVRRVFEAVHQESIEQQNVVMSGKA